MTTQSFDSANIMIRQKAKFELPSEHSILGLSPLFMICSVVVVASLVLGGGTRGGFLSDAILQLVALPLLLVALWQLPDLRLTTQARWAVGICLAIVIIPLIQLVPLPPVVWTKLPNRAVSSEVFDLLGASQPWMPISISPTKTWLSAISLIPPVAVFLAVLLLSYRERRWLSLLVIAVGTLGVFIGLLQVAQGPGSTLRFYEITNPTEAVGFFANRNHFAALGYVLLLFTAAWVSNASFSLAKLSKERDFSSILSVLLWSTLIIVLIAGEAMARSRAGLGLTILALFGALAISISDQRTATFSTPTKLIGGAMIVAVLFTVQFTLYRIWDRFEAGPLDDWRLLFFPTTIEAARAYLPLGSGLGTFVSVYPLFEQPKNTIAETYANHAHNDFAELWLETGVIGLFLLLSFLAWFATRAAHIWRTSSVDGSAIDILIMRAATVAVLLIVLHSAVDYPLRTSAILTVFAISCAFMIPSQVSTAGHPAKEATHAKPRLTSGERPVTAAVAQSAVTMEPADLAHPSLAPRPTAGPIEKHQKPQSSESDQDSKPSQAIEAPSSQPSQQRPDTRGRKQPSAPQSVAEAVEQARKRAQLPAKQDTRVKVEQAPKKSQLPAKQDTRVKPVQIAGGDQAMRSVKATSGERWGQDVEWPEEWRQTQDRDKEE